MKNNYNKKFKSSGTLFTPEYESLENETSDEVENESNEETDDKTEFMKGRVSNCSRLNIRKEPSIDSEILWIVNSGDVLNIYKNSTHDWCSVVTESGVKGFCMRKYVSIEE